MGQILSKIESETLAHHGLVAATIQDIGLIEKINARLPLNVSKGGKISHGHRSAAMIINGLGYVTRTLYLSSHFFDSKPVERLLGIAVEAEELNDDMLGRHLDAISGYGSTKLFSELAFEICQEQSLFGKSNHVDTTTLKLYGDYDNYGDSSPLPCLGYSKDHRPDLKQVTLSLTQTSEGHIPLWMEALDGNSSDKKSFQKTVRAIEHFKQTLEQAPAQRFILDAAFYHPDKLAELSEVSWLTRVPATLQEAKVLLTTASRACEWQTVDDKNKISAYSITLSGIKQRWLMVSSKAAQEREKKTLFRRLDKAYEALNKSLWHLSKQIFSCEADAKKAIATVIRKNQSHWVDYVIEPVMKHQTKGRPKQGEYPVCKGYRCTSTIATNLEVVRHAIDVAGRFILATNDLDKEAFRDTDMLCEYKAQTHVERGFRFLKSDSFELNHIFLKNPNRIGALMMIMTLCLLVYNFAEYRLRQQLENSEHVLPNQLGKPIKNPTLRWIFQLMKDITLVKVYDDVQQQWHFAVCRLNTLHRLIVCLMGNNARKIYGVPIAENFPDYDKNRKNLIQWCGM
jgi:transposase